MDERIGCSYFCGADPVLSIGQRTVRVSERRQEIKIRGGALPRKMDCSSSINIVSSLVVECVALQYDPKSVNGANYEYYISTCVRTYCIMRILLRGGYDGAVLVTDATVFLIHILYIISHQSLSFLSLSKL